MPKVPTYDNLQATPSAQPAARIDAPQTFDFAGQQTQQLGQGLQRFGGSMDKIAGDIAARANHIRYLDGDTKLQQFGLDLEFDKDKGFRNIKGDKVYEPDADGQDMRTRTLTQFQQRAAEIAATLSNDAQREMFNESAKRQAATLAQRLTTHQAAEWQNHQDTAYRGRLQLSQNTAGLMYDNPEAVKQALDDADAATVALQSGVHGNAAPLVEASRQAARSSIHMAVITAAMSNNKPSYAAEYFRLNKGELVYSDLLRANKEVNSANDAWDAQNISSEYMRRYIPQGGVHSAQSVFDRAVISMESSGKQLNKDGAPLTSSAGAIGVAQIMPDTAKRWAKQAGIPWDEQRYKTDKDYNYQLGLFGFGTLMQRYGNDPGKAMAAYNAGEGWIDAAVSRAKQAAPGTEQADWFWQLNNDGRSKKNREETRNYVTNGLKRVESTSEPTAEEVIQSMRADPRFKDRPVALKLAVETLKADMAMHRDATQQRATEAVANAHRELLANGGVYARLSPENRQALERYAPDKVPAVQKFGTEISLGQEVVTDPALFLEILKQAHEEPKKFASRDLLKDANRLSRSDIRSLGELQAKANDPKNQPEVQTLQQQLELAHGNLGLTTAAQKAAFSSKVMQALQEETRTQGKTLTYDQRQQIINRYMLNKAAFLNTKFYQVAGTANEKYFTPHMSDDDRAAAIHWMDVHAPDKKKTEENLWLVFKAGYGIK